MDLKHSDMATPETPVVAEAFMPGSKSSDLIKPTSGSKNGLDKPHHPPGTKKY